VRRIDRIKGKENFDRNRNRNRKGRAKCDRIRKGAEIAKKESIEKTK